MFRFMRQIKWQIVLLWIGCSSVLSAQPGGDGRWMNPEQRAEQLTAQMEERLALSEAQAVKVREINLKYARQAQENREKADGDWEAMRAQMMRLRQAQEEELRSVLTEEQWQQWLKIREEERMRRGWGNATPSPKATDKAEPAKERPPKKPRGKRNRDANPNGNR